MRTPPHCVIPSGAKRNRGIFAPGENGQRKDPSTSLGMTALGDGPIANAALPRGGNAKWGAAKEFCSTPKYSICPKGTPQPPHGRFHPDMGRISSAIGGSHSSCGRISMKLTAEPCGQPGLRSSLPGSSCPGYRPEPGRRTAARRKRHTCQRPANAYW